MTVNAFSSSISSLYSYLLLIYCKLGSQMSNFVVRCWKESILESSFFYSWILNAHVELLLREASCLTLPSRSGSGQQTQEELAKDQPKAKETAPKGHQ